MDNAAKALLMAAEILIAILILTLAIYAFVYYRDVAVTYEKSQISQETEKFNNQFTKYLGQDVTIQEIVTLVHLAQDYNEKVDNGVKAAGGKQSKVEVFVYYMIVNKTPSNTAYEHIKLTGISDDNLIKYIKLNNSVEVEKRTFKCNKVLYNDEGRVCQIEFRFNGY